MTGRGPVRRPSNEAIARVVELAPVLFAVIAEAAWIAVVGALVQGFGQHDSVLGVPILALFVGGGIVAARVAGPRLGPSWPVAALALVVTAAVVGWLMSEPARIGLAGGIGPSLAAHPGGWVAGLAVLRGFAHARLPLAEGTVSRLLGIGVPALAVMALVGGVMADPFRDRFLADALGDAIVFVAATVLALAFARLGAVGADGGFDWRRNPAWLGLTILLLILAIVAAIPLSSVAGTAISTVISVALGPLFILGLATGIDRTGRRVLLFFIAVLIVAFVLTRGPIAATLSNPATPTATSPLEPSPAEQVMAMSIGGLLLLGLVVGALILIALWMRRTAAPDDLIREERTIDAGGEPTRPRPRRTRFGRRIEPATAAEAYVALVNDLDRHEDVRRGSAETPIEHAARLRSIGRAGLSLDLLAADYALARYGGVDLTAREDRRAVARWRVLRRRVPTPPAGWRPPAHRPGAIAPDAAPPVDVDPRRTL